MGKVFTLLELLTVVAITMVLAALGLPIFHEMSLKAKEAEIRPNLESIVDTAMAYEMSLGSGPLGGISDFTTLYDGKKRVAFVPDGFGFQDIGWSPDGDIYAYYEFNNGGDSGGGYCDSAGTSGLAYVPNTSIYAYASQDLDGDGESVLTVGCEAAPGTNHTVEVRGRTAKHNSTGSTGCGWCGSW